MKYNDECCSFVALKSKLKEIENYPKNLMSCLED